MLDEPEWLKADLIVAIAKLSVKKFGGFSSDVRDESLLLSALVRPRNKWVYGNPKPDLFELAASYCSTFACGHVFLDGNKRIAYLAAVSFLGFNRIICSPEAKDIVHQMYRIARGELDETEIAKWLKDNSSQSIAN